VDLRGKRIGVIGTGASGVQVIQECGPDASHLTVFQRTPNLALPMVQHPVDARTQDKMKECLYPYMMRRRYQTFSGFHFNMIFQDMLSTSPEERMLMFDELWTKGGFHFWLGAYQDTFSDERANDEVYRFWQKKVWERLENDEMRRKLAPEVAPHPFGVKRPCLEQRYYEVYNQPNVTLVDVNENPISEITSKGVRTQDGKEHELDALVIATGFDAVTGSIAQIDIRGTDGVLVREKWGRGLATYLGLSVANYPNMFFTYGPHGPTAFCNGPTCAVYYPFSSHLIPMLTNVSYRNIKVTGLSTASNTCAPTTLLASKPPLSPRKNGLISCRGRTRLVYGTRRNHGTMARISREKLWSP
jgi:cation diffusion facilitator CzcD-associated flavoprotein CzcO